MAGAMPARRAVGPLVVILVATACSLGPRTGNNSESDVGSTTNPAATTTTEVEARLFYTVRRGDTLVHIATRFDIDLNALVRENGIADPTKIFVGQQLLIPPPPDEADGPLLTIAPATNPDLPAIQPTLPTLPTPTAQPNDVITGEP